MLNILNLFGRSPFSPLQLHMEKVAICVSKIREIFLALKNEDYKQVELLSKQISDLEHEADLTKNNIRNHLTKDLFLLIDRRDLLDILSIQDSLADKAEDIGVLLTIKKLKIEPFLQPHFDAFLDKNMESFTHVLEIMQELNELLETSFGGLEADKVKNMIKQVAFLEHEADLLQHVLLKHLFNHGNQLEHPTFYLWLKIFEEIGCISNLSEKLGNRIRMLLEVK